MTHHTAEGGETGKANMATEASTLHDEIELLRQRLASLEASVPGYAPNQPHGKKGKSRTTRNAVVLLAAAGMLAVLAGAGMVYSEEALHALFVSTNGYVGIGTTQPSQRLTLGSGNILLPNANGENDGNLYFGGTTNAGQNGLRLFGGLVNGAIPAGFVDVRTTDPKDGLRIRVDTVNGGTERMRVTAEGNIGIGTDAPKAKLDVQQDNRIGAHPASVRGLYVTGDFSPDSGVEFRHSNGSQGIGFGYNTIYATGNNASQDINLKPRGNGKVNIAGQLEVKSVKIGNAVVGEKELLALKKLASGTLIVDLFNTKQKEYLYAADYAPYDKDRRRVFTWRKGNRINQGHWQLRFAR